MNIKHSLNTHEMHAREAVGHVNCYGWSYLYSLGSMIKTHPLRIFNNPIKKGF